VQFSPLSSFRTQIQIVSAHDANIQFDIVYRLVQHFAQTVKLFSHMLQWRPSPSSGQKALQTEKCLLQIVSILSRTHRYISRRPLTQSRWRLTSHVSVRGR